MRILQVSDFFLPSLGGVERVLLELGRRLRKRGHVVHVLTFRWQPHWPYREVVEELPVTRYPIGRSVFIYPTAIAGGRRAFRQLWGQADYDLLHFHLTLSALGPLLAKESNPVPKLFTFYGPWAEEMAVELRGKPLPCGLRQLYRGYVWGLCQMLRMMQRWVLQCCDATVVLSQYSRQQATALLGQENPEPQLIPGGVDIERFRPAEDKRTVRQRLGLPVDRFLLLTVRRLVPRMGLENLVRAFAVLRRQDDAWHLIIGGQGRLMEALRAQVQEFGLEGQVTFTGFIPEDDLPAYYQAADLFVVPTVALEGFGLITLEALASGLPVVGTPVGSTKEILARFDARFLAWGTQASDLAEKIVEARHILQQEDIGSRARSFAVTYYNWDSIVDRYEDLYQQLCAPRQG